MQLNIETNRNGYERLITPDFACLYYKKESNVCYRVSTESDVQWEETNHCGWIFNEQSLRQAAELFLRLADDISDALEQRTEDQ
jgi:hypothetical protein